MKRSRKITVSLHYKCWINIIKIWSNINVKQFENHCYKWSNFFFVKFNLIVFRGDLEHFKWSTQPSISQNFQPEKKRMSKYPPLLTWRKHVEEINKNKNQILIHKTWKSNLFQFDLCYSVMFFCSPKIMCPISQVICSHIL